MIVLATRMTRSEELKMAVIIIILNIFGAGSYPQWGAQYQPTVISEESYPAVQEMLTEDMDEKKPLSDNVVFNSYDWYDPQLIEHYCNCIDMQSCPAALEVLRKQPRIHEDLESVKMFTCGFSGFRPFICCNLFMESLIFRQNKRKRAHFSYGSYGRNPQSTSYDIDERTKHHFYWDSMSFPHWSHAPTDNVPYNGHSCGHPHEYHRRPMPRRPTTTTTTEETFVLDIVEDPEVPPPATELPETTMVPVTTPTTTTSTTTATSTTITVAVTITDPPAPPPTTVTSSVAPETTVAVVSTEIQNRISKKSQFDELICGTTIERRIVGGEDAKLGDYPWMARLGYRRNNAQNILFRCGGSLINNRYVVTAAHCVTTLPTGLQLVQIRLGELDERSNPDCEDGSCGDPPRDFELENITVHPSYNTPRLSNDIALVRLGSQVQFTSYINPLCLPFAEPTESFQNLSGTNAVVAGWGSTNTGFMSGSPTLKWVRLTIIPTEQCMQIYRTRFDITISSQQICTAGDANRDACEGDSGGPLFLEGDGTRRATLIGIVSFGPRRCGTAALPGVYTRVDSYLDWILDSITI